MSSETNKSLKGKPVKRKIISIYRTLILKGFDSEPNSGLAKLLDAGLFSILEELIEKSLLGKPAFFVLLLSDSDDLSLPINFGFVDSKFFGFSKVLESKPTFVHPSRIFSLDCQLFVEAELDALSDSFEEIFKDFLKISKLGNITYLNTSFEVPSGVLGKSSLDALKSRFENAFNSSDKVLLLGRGEEVKNIVRSVEPTVQAWNAQKQKIGLHSLLPPSFFFSDGEIQGDFSLCEATVLQIQQMRLKPLINRILQILKLDTNWSFVPLNLSRKQEKKEELEIARQEIEIEKEKFELEKAKFEFEEHKKEREKF